jgi:anti-sigma B factor antagonist
MQITERQVGDVMLLELDGRLILEEGEFPLREAVDRLVAAGKTKIVLDLARVTRIDSAGIGMLVSKYLTAFRKGGRLKLLHLTRRADNALHLTKLSSVFEVFDSEDEAVASFKFLPRKHGTSV